MAESDKNDTIHTMLQLEYFSSYDVEYDSGRVSVVLGPEL
jgi:hypothetical protein